MNQSIHSICIHLCWSGKFSSGRKNIVHFEWWKRSSRQNLWLRNLYMDTLLKCNHRFQLLQEMQCPHLKLDPIWHSKDNFPLTSKKRKISLIYNNIRKWNNFSIKNRYNRIKQVTYHFLLSFILYFRRQIWSWVKGY